MSQALSFNDVSFDVIPQNSQPWVRGSQIATALQYSSVQRVIEIYTRHADEFTEAMTAMITLPTEGGPQETRIFSLRGCHLIAMFARTPVAKAFRRWVLDVLDQLAAQERALTSNGVSADTLPPASVTLSPSTTADRAPLRSMVNAWSKVSGQPHDALWPQVRAAFNLGNIKELPTEWVPDAIAWVQEKIDARPAPTTLTQQPKLTFFPVEHIVSAKEQQPGPVETSLLNLAEQLPELENMVERVRIFNNQLAGLTSGLFHEETNRILRGASSADYATRRDISGALYAQHVNMVNHAVFMTQWARSAVATGIAMAHAMRK